MKPTATGRVLFWRGGSLWIGLAGEPTGVHAHHAIQITLPFAPGRVRLLRHGGDWRDYAAAIVAADEAHAFEARGQHVAQIFVEPESREGRLLQQLYGDARISEPSSGALERHAAALAKGFLDRADDAELIARAQATVAMLAGTAPASMDPIDARIARAVKLIRERLGGTVPLREIADAVHLSPDRFRHLFMQETGVAFRPYLLWLRLECALAAYVNGATLTEAAQSGGFADSAHLSRTFRRMFGIAPATLRAD